VAGSSQVVVAVTNEGDGDDRLVGAETPAALGVEVHLTELDGGRATMAVLDEVELPAGEKVRFRPGGLHLMLVVPDESVAVGGTFELTLRFERSDAVTVPVEVVDLLDLTEGDADPDADEDADDDGDADADP
jgi:periplasmic copper chaperone A